MNKTVREQQYAYNGRMFIPPETQKFTLDNIGNNDNPNNNVYTGLIQPLTNNESVNPYELYKTFKLKNKILT